MLLIHDNVLDEALLGAEAEYSDTFPVENVIDRKSSKRYRSYRAPNLMLYGNCDSTTAPTLDGTPVAAANATWARDESTKYEGTSSWKMTKITAAGAGYANAYFQDSVSTTDMHGLSVATTYEITLQMRTNASLATYAALQIQAYVGAAWNSVLTLSAASLNAWHIKHGRFTLPTGTTGVQIKAILDTNAAAGVSMWTDKIIFWDGNGVMRYGECEMTDSPSLDVGYTATNCTFARSAFPYTGTYSWKINKSTAAGAGTAFNYFQANTLTTDMHNLIAGNTYYFDLYAYTSVVTPGNALIRIAAYVGGSWTTIKTWTHTVSAAWQHFYGSVTVPVGTTGIQFYGRIDTAEAVNTAIWVDVMSCKPETRLTFDLYSAVAPEFAAFIGDNLSTSATAYFQANTSASWTSPAISEAITKNTTTGLWLLELVNSTAYRYWSLVIYDFDYNEEGYVEVGYAHLGDADRYNGIDVEFAERPVPKDTDQESDSGETTGTDGAFLLEWDIGIPDCYLATKTQLDTMIRATRKHTPFIWVADENNIAKFPARYVKWTAFDYEHIGGFELYSFKGSVKETV